MPTGGDELSKPEKRARGLLVHGADRGHHGGQRERHRTLRFAASCTHHHHRWLHKRLNHGQNADSRNIVPRSLRLKPLVWEQPRYLLCTCGKARLTVFPRAHTVSVAVTIRLRDVYRACFPRPKSGWQSGTTSSGRSRRLYFLPTYPYPTHGGAEPISGGPRGRQGSVKNPTCLEDIGSVGKGLKPSLEPPFSAPELPRSSRRGG